MGGAGPGGLERVSDATVTCPETGTRPPTGLRSFRALMVAGARSAWNRATSASKAERLRGFIFAGLLGAFFLSAEYLSWRLFHAFVVVGDVTISFIAILLALRLLGLLFLIVLSLLFFGSLIAAIDALYFDEDIDFLASRPFGRSVLLARKLVSVYLTSAWIVFLIVTPVMTGYGRALGLGFAHLPLSLVSLFLFSVAPPALAASVVIALMRFLPVDRARESVLAVGAALSFGVVYLYRLLSPRNLARPELLVADATRFVREFTLPLADAIPSQRMAKALVAAVPLRYGEWAVETGLLAAMALGAVAIYFAVGRLAYATDRPVSGSAARPGPLERGLALAPAARLLSRLAPPGRRALVFKELMTNVRDPMQISHLVLMIGIVALHFANLSEIPYDLHPAARILVAFLNLGLVGFLVAGVAVRFVYPSLSLEGRPFWLVETAPIPVASIVRIKFLAAWIPLTACALGIVLVSNTIVGVGAGLTWTWGAATVAITTAITALGLALSVKMPVFEKRNVFEISSSPGGIIFMIASLLFVGVSIMVLVPATWDAAFAGEVRAGRAFAALAVIAGVALAVTEWSRRAAEDGIRNFTEVRYGE